ncbi:MAG: hypothetical protein R3F36_00770 [Candidatus Competibacteraceae bacterium]
MVHLQDILRITQGAVAHDLHQISQ